MSDKVCTVHIDGNRTLEIEVPDDTKTAGEFADHVAKEHNVAGREFSFKADGEVLDRSKTVSKKLAESKILELVEVSDAPVNPTAGTEADAAAEQASGDSQPPADPDAVPEGNVDAVVDWVRGTEAGNDPTEGWEDRAQRAVDAEYERDDPRSSVIEPLEAALARAAEEAENQGR